MGRREGQEGAAAEHESLYSVRAPKQLQEQEEEEQQHEQRCDSAAAAASIH